MKARSKELLDRSIAAMVAAIDVYNKPDFPYRAESFTILALNSWELLLKAKWLADHDNRMRKHAGRFSRFAMAHQEAQEPSPRFPALPRVAQNVAFCGNGHRVMAVMLQSFVDH